jgi:glycosyltransferase involved in cell wall biosynthesis
MKQQRVIVSVTNDLYTDQRVHKVCSYLYEQGFDVLVVGRLLPESKSVEDRPYQTHRMRLFFKKGALFYAFYNLRLFLFLLFRKADILLSNDLDTLLANHLARAFKRNCRLVYDSHELFTEVPELTSRPTVRKAWLAIENWIFPTLKHVYTVNQSIATIYTKKYAVPVGVVRNVSPLWKPSKLSTKAELSIPEDKKMIILQGAGINVDRGGEEAVIAMQWIENAILYIVGSGDVIGELKALTQSLSITDKVRFVDRVPYDVMMNYTYHADLGLTLDKDTNPNYKYSLPNKVFDYIHANTPILSSQIIEIKRIIDQHKVGKVLKTHDPKVIAETINQLLSNDQQLIELKENCKKAASEENWDKEKQGLAPYFLS